MTYEIENGVPIAPRAYKREMTYPFDKLNVGDSFLVGRDKAPSVRSRATTYGKSSKRVFRTRICEDGLRVWRVA